MRNQRFFVAVAVLCGSLCAVVFGGHINPLTGTPMQQENVKSLRHECEVEGCDAEEIQEAYREDAQEQDEENNVWVESKGATFGGFSFGF